MDPNNKYTEMQKRKYGFAAKPWDKSKKNPINDQHEPVTGNFKRHNEWKDYDRFMFAGIDDKRIVLDFACGPGRNIVKFWNICHRIDGVDINQTNLDNAKLWMKHNDIDPKRNHLYLCNGVDLENVIVGNGYDVVISTIAFQHICVHEIRFNYLKEFFRVLKPGGWISIQMGFGKNENRTFKTIDYFTNNYNAMSTNGEVDVQVSSVDQIKTDLDKIGFTQFNFNIRETGPFPPWSGMRGHPNWIFFRAKKPF
jgi:ubiquinone/menaquinone biosynthesis C-methylase UbiE